MFRAIQQPFRQEKNKTLLVDIVGIDCGKIHIACVKHVSKRSNMHRAYLQLPLTTQFIHRLLHKITVRLSTTYTGVIDGFYTLSTEPIVTIYLYKRGEPKCS